ncbi:MAG TPA: prepilin-type N-terminal cleavage/methylation domain-containing protein [Pyrinomonadaceae bacterium]|nr:prepilin-type N-terminal cleavage/methylation domain-containing protein [Pyrinomonadaceae bacterium]
MSNEKIQKSNKNGEDGFSLIEAVIAIFIVTIGLIGTAAAITFALEFGAISQNVTKAKLVIVGSIEEVETLRNSRRLNYKQIANVGKVDNSDSRNVFGGFSNDLRPVGLNPGPDGVNGTDDDLRDPGEDGVFGTTDDFDNSALARGGFWRKITITDLSKTLKKIEVTVRYVGRGGKLGEISGVSYLNDEAHADQ